MSTVDSDSDSQSSSRSPTPLFEFQMSPTSSSQRYEPLDDDDDYEGEAAREQNYDSEAEEQQCSVPCSPVRQIATQTQPMPIAVGSNNLHTSSATTVSLHFPSSLPEPERARKKRCSVCRKKLGLVTFACQCGGEFCAKHRSGIVRAQYKFDCHQPERYGHLCTVDWSAQHRQRLERQMQRSLSEKRRQHGMSETI